MAVHFSILVILIGLTGIHSITTVHKVSVKAGHSVSIPCSYDSKYKTNVKYLCKGNYLDFCTYIVKTNQQHSGRFQISDDKNQRMFTVNMTALRETETSYYWCAVEIDRGKDDGEYFYLSVTKGTPSLFVNHQHLTVYKEDNITISCFHQQSGDIKWCRLGGSCVMRPSKLKDGTRVDIKRGGNVFNVTMSGLRMESSGWYLCIKGDFQMPVHITVTERPTTTSSLTTLSPTPDSVNLTSTVGDKPATIALFWTTVTPTTVQGEHPSVSVALQTVIIPLALLILILTVCLSVYCIFKKRKQTQAAPSACAANTEDSSVVYSSVVAVRKARLPTVEDYGENVVYSTLA